MPVKISASEQPLNKVFCTDYDFNIPLYQRPYAWTTKEAGELLSDLIENMGEGTPVEETGPYFLGSVVLVKGDSPVAEVVDGQQRLTTLTILFAALRPYLSQAESLSLTKLLYETADPILGLDNRYRLKLRPQDAEFFQKYIQGDGGIAMLKDLNPASLTDSRKNIRDVGLLFLNAAEKLLPQNRARLVRFAVLRCFLVVVSTPDFSSAYRIFTVLNNRGLNLTHADILKAELIGRVQESAQSDYSRKWEDAEDMLGRDGFQDLFSHIRMIYRKTKLAGTVLQEFRDHILKDTVDAAKFIDEVVLTYADAYEVITTCSYLSATGADAVNRLLKWLNKIDNVDWIPPAIWYLSKNPNDSASLCNFLADLERLAAGQMILRCNINERITRYARLITALETSADLYSPDSPLQLTDAEKSGIVKILGGDLYFETKTRLYVLLRLDVLLAQGQVEYNYSTITVEHVLPQTPAADSVWMNWFPTEEIREKYTHQLANLVLLTRKKNSEAQNYDFEDKKKKYFSSAKGVCTFALTSQVLNTKDWTSTVLDARQTSLLLGLKTLWRL